MNYFNTTVQYKYSGLFLKKYFIVIVLMNLQIQLRFKILVKNCTPVSVEYNVKLLLGCELFLLDPCSCDVWDKYQSSDKNFWHHQIEKNWHRYFLRKNVLALNPHDFSKIRFLFNRKINLISQRKDSTT